MFILIKNNAFDYLVKLLESLPAPKSLSNSEIPGSCARICVTHCWISPQCWYTSL